MTTHWSGSERPAHLDFGEAYDPLYRTDYPGPKGDFSGPIIAAIGPEDPETDASERKLYRLQIPYFHARNHRGERAQPAEVEAYDAYCSQEIALAVQKADILVTVECALPRLKYRVLKEIDHHGSRFPARLYRSLGNAAQISSIGQLADFVGEPLTLSEEIVGALDERAALVLAGEHPTIDPDKACDVMLHEIVRKTQKVAQPSPDSLVSAHKELFVCRHEILPSLPTVKLDETVDILDGRAREFEPGYSAGSLITKTGACMEKVAVLTTARDARPGYPARDSLTGYVTLGQIEAFRDVWVPKQGLTHVVIDVERRIAMGYRPGEFDRALNYCA